MQSDDKAQKTLRLAGLSDGAHPAVLFAMDTKHAGLLDAIHGRNKDSGDLVHALGA